MTEQKPITTDSFAGKNGEQPAQPAGAQPPADQKQADQPAQPAAAPAPVANNVEPPDPNKGEGQKLAADQPSSEHQKPAAAGTTEPAAQQHPQNQTKE